MAKTTTNHDEIRKWAEERGGKPACVKGTGSGDDPGILRIDFPGYSGEESLAHLSWDTWLKAFDDNGLALIYEEGERGGGKSRFNKIVARDTVERRERGESGASRHSDR